MPYEEMFQIKLLDVNDIYTLYHVTNFCKNFMWQLMKFDVCLM
jgi:hypothetical protein